MSQNVLQPLRARVAGWLTLRVVVSALAVLGLLALAAVLFDAAVDLPEWIRAAAPWVLGAAIVTFVGAGILEWRGLTEERLARQFERGNPALGNRLINAVQLARKPGRTATEECLRRDAVGAGREAARQLQVWPHRRGGIRRAVAAFACAAAAWGVLVFAGKDLVSTVWPRFTDAHGDHPPYSRLKLEVSPDCADVLYGGQFEVRAITHGRPADKLWLVARTGTNETRTVMFLAPDKSFFQTLANLREPAEYFVTDGSARSRRYPITIRYTPQITAVEVSTVFPEYTGKPPHDGKLGDDPQAYPEDTRVTFRVASNRPLGSGAVELTPVLGGKPIRVELRPQMPNTVVTGAFTLSQPVAFALSVRDVSGLDCAEPRRGRLNVVPDRAPRLEVVEPGRDAVATPTTRVPVRVEATDDYGISRVVWLRGMNRSIERPFRMKLALAAGPASIETTGAFDLAQLGVQAGDVIDYYFEAADNYPKGPHVVFSRPFRLQVISQKQYDAILRQAAARKALFEPYFKLDAWLGRLAERARDLEKKAAQSDPSARTDAEALSKELSEYQQALGKLLQEPTMFDVEQSFRTAMVAQHTAVSEAAANLKNALGGSGAPNPDQMKALSDALNALARKQDEEVEQPAQHLASVARVMARADAFVKLAQEQAALAGMLRRFSERTNALSRLEQVEMQELAHQQRRIEGELHDMVEQLPEMLALVPADKDYDPLRQDVRDFLRAVGDAKIEDDMNGAGAALEEPDGLTGYALATSAAVKMDKLISKCSSLSGKPCLEAHFKPQMSKGMGNSLDQILAAMGANQGTGQNGNDGYALFNESVGLYGPNVELAGEQPGGRGNTAGSSASRVERMAGGGNDAGLPPPEAPGHVRLQPDAKFPLRYRDLVGEYFRVIAESEKEGEK